MSVDLPEPEGPMMAVNAPVVNSTETSRSATTWASPVPYAFQRPSAVTAARVDGGAGGTATDTVGPFQTGCFVVLRCQGYGAQWHPTSVCGPDLRSPSGWRRRPCLAHAAETFG
jgi:hypothetical protein